MPTRPPPRGPAELPRRRRGEDGLLGPDGHLHGEPAQGVLGRRGDPGERLRVRLPAAPDRRPRHLRDRARTDRQEDLRVLPGRREPGDRARQREDAAPGHGQPRLVGRPGHAYDRDATFWKDGPEIETGEMVTEQIGTEVFFLPCANHTEKSGTFTEDPAAAAVAREAVHPPGDARSELQFFYHLGRRMREKLAGSTDDARPPAARPHVGLPDARDRTPSPTPEAVLGEINGYDAEGRPLSSFTQLKADGSTTRRLLDLHGRLRGRGQPGRPAQARLRAGLGGRGVGLGVAGEPPHALQPRLRRPGRPAVERAQGLRLVGRGVGPLDRLRRAGLRGRPSRRRTVPEEGATGRGRAPGDDAFIMQADGKAWLYAPAGLADGPLPTHYEPVESPVREPAHGQQANPAASAIDRARGTG